MKRFSLVIILLLLLSGLAVTLVRASPGERRLLSMLSRGFDLSWWTVEGGGATASSGGDFSLNGGFWNRSMADTTPTPTVTPSATPTVTIIPTSNQLYLPFLNR
jgi:hypothetical protein